MLSLSIFYLQFKLLAVFVVASIGFSFYGKQFMAKNSLWVGAAKTELIIDYTNINKHVSLRWLAKQSRPWIQTGTCVCKPISILFFP